MNSETSIYEKNMETIKRRLPPCYEGIIKYKKSINKSSVIIDESVKGEKIVAVEYNEHLYYFNSRYDADAGVRSWIEGFEKINFKSIVIMCGMANLMHSRELLKKFGDENILIIYEPNPEILIRVIEEIDVVDVLDDYRTFLFSENINMTYFRQYFSILFEYERVNYSKIIVLPNYSEIYKDPIGKFIDLCEKEIIGLEVDKNTNINLGKEINDNYIDNIWYSIFSSSIDELKKEIDKINIENIPCIIVAAGPSLDKNIDRIRDAKGRALIIVVDSAIKAVLARDIIPDLLITIDSHKPMTLFEDKRISDIPLVVCMQSRVDILKQHEGKQFMFASNNYIKGIYKHFDKELEVLSTGGSVANNAFSLAKFLGFKTIILIGQDLAFTNNKKHVGNTYKEKEIGEDKSELYIEIEDNDGNPILTFANFKVYRDWFEAEIKDSPEIHVINATEGGAKIHGAEILTFKEAIDKNCVESVDFDRLISQANSSFSIKEKIEFYNMLKNMPEKLKVIKIRLRKGIRDYNKLYDLIRKGKNHTSEFKKVLDLIEEVNTLDSTEPLMEFIRMYAKEEEYIIGQDMYGVDDCVDIKTEAREISDRGIAMLQAYIKGVDKALDRVNYVLNEIVDESRILDLKD